MQMESNVHEKVRRGDGGGTEVRHARTWLPSSGEGRPPQSTASPPLLTHGVHLGAGRVEFSALFGPPIKWDDAAKWKVVVVVVGGRAIAVMLVRCCSGSFSCLT